MGRARKGHRELSEALGKIGRPIAPHLLQLLPPLVLWDLAKIAGFPWLPPKREAPIEYAKGVLACALFGWMNGGGGPRDPWADEQEPTLDEG